MQIKQKYFLIIFFLSLAKSLQTIDYTDHEIERVIRTGERYKGANNATLYRSKDGGLAVVIGLREYTIYPTMSKEDLTAWLNKRPQGDKKFNLQKAREKLYNQSKDR